MSREFVESLAEMILHLTYKDINIILYLPPDTFGQFLFNEILIERGLINKSRIVVTASERVHCLRSWPEHLERGDVKPYIKALVVNKIPMGVFDHVKEDVVRFVTLKNLNSKSLIVSLIPLTMQLYYRDFDSYIPLPIKAEMNEHAKSLSNLVRKIVRVLLGLDDERKLVTVVRGMISETVLAGILA
jgi:hypothetical protein